MPNVIVCHKCRDVVAPGEWLPVMEPMGEAACKRCFRMADGRPYQHHEPHPRDDGDQ